MVTNFGLFLFLSFHYQHFTGTKRVSGVPIQPFLLSTCPLGGGDVEPIEIAVDFSLNPIHACNGRHEGRGGFGKWFSREPVEWGTR